MAAGAPQRPAILGLRRSLRPLALFVMMFLVLGGLPTASRRSCRWPGREWPSLVLVAMALLWAAPYALIVSELVTALPQEGAIYPWFRVSFGRFWSFVFAYVDWVTWILDSCLYPPLVAAYLLALLTPDASRASDLGGLARHHLEPHAAEHPRSRRRGPLLGSRVAWSWPSRSCCSSCSAGPGSRSPACGRSCRKACPSARR